MTAEHAAGVGGEVDLWADLFDTDAMRSCSCPSCNHYLPHDKAEAARLGIPAYDPDAECEVVTVVKAIAKDTRQTAADTVLAAARRLCCGDNPAPHHAATHDHSQRMAFAEELARAVRGS
jgi:hypothetical protein